MKETSVRWPDSVLVRKCDAVIVEEDAKTWGLIKLNLDQNREKD